MILDRILERKKSEVAGRKHAAPVAELMACAADMPAAVDFAAALRRGKRGLPALIAEVKKASPSKGVIRADFDPVSIAEAYQSGGAAAISVLTDEEFFQGSLDYLTLVKNTVEVPVLRKDFIVDEYQLFEARAAGADAVLLIVAALQKEKLVALMESAALTGLQCLVEVHDEHEMETALAVGARLIGINNRNLHTFKVDLETTSRLRPMADDAKVVSESGIFSRKDMEKLGRMNVDAVLVGEALMRERDIEAKLRELVR